MSSITSLFAAVASNVGQLATLVKSTVEATTQDFEAEQQKFIEEQKRQQQREVAAGASAGTVNVQAAPTVRPPWHGSPVEDELRTSIMELAKDKRNFLLDPPEGTRFTFDIAEMLPQAMAVMAADPELERHRFQLVPKQVSEERFWRNYFYRVTLLKQALELSHQPPTPTPRAVPAAPAAAPAGAAPEPPGGAADGSPAKPAVAAAEPAPAAASTGGKDPTAAPAEAAAPASPRAESPKPAPASSVEPSGDFDWEKELEKELGDYKAPAAAAPLPVVRVASRRTGAEAWEAELEDALK